MSERSRKKRYEIPKRKKKSCKVYKKKNEGNNGIIGHNKKN